MKKYFLIAAAGLVLSSCNTNEKEMKALNHDRDSLMMLVNERDSSLNEFMISYDEIEKNLDAVAAKQDIISMNIDKQPKELKTSTKDRINAEIKAINDLMEKNRSKIAELNRKLKNSGSKIAGFEKMIQSLNEQVAQKDTELLALNTQLTSLNTQVAQLQTSVDTLSVVSSQQANTISEQTTSLHTAYYIVGKSKELQESKVIDKTGGLLGIGKSPKLSDAFDNSKFTRIDYTQTMSIPVNSDGKIVTTHPKDSYELDKDTKDKDKIVNVRITNPEKFWSASKYLVVVKN